MLRVYRSLSALSEVETTESFRVHPVLALAWPEPESSESGAYLAWSHDQCVYVYCTCTACYLCTCVLHVYCIIVYLCTYTGVLLCYESTCVLHVYFTCTGWLFMSMYKCTGCAHAISCIRGYVDNGHVCWILCVLHVYYTLCMYIVLVTT